MKKYVFRFAEYILLVLVATAIIVACVEALNFIVDLI